MKYEKLIKEIVEYASSNYAKYDGVTYEKVIGKTRKRPVVEIRQLCIFFIKNKWKQSLEVSGHILGDRDHATALHSINVVENLIRTNIRYRQLFNEIDDLINDKYFYDKKYQYIRLTIVPEIIWTQTKTTEDMSLDDFKKIMFEYRKDVDEIVFKVDKTRAVIKLKNGTTVEAVGRDKLHYLVNDYIWR